MILKIKNQISVLITLIFPLNISFIEDVLNDGFSCDSL